tara:strand:+ start:220 stop:432 length:213 start_codon:yes stop_codon:yes gene_type:complete
MGSRISKSELAIQRAKKYLRSQGIMNKKDEDKMSDKIRKKMEEILKLDIGGSVSRGGRAAIRGIKFTGVK